MAALAGIFYFIAFLGLLFAILTGVWTVFFFFLVIGIALSVLKGWLES
jgi:hypothetical protein